jgi:hypothetical protein
MLGQSYQASRAAGASRGTADPYGHIAELNPCEAELDQTGLAWEAITRSRNLAAYVPADFPDPQMELIIILPRAA